MTIYDAYVPIMSKALTSLHAILTKAEAHAKENGTDADTEYIGASIYSDMKPLPFQIQTVANMVKVTSIPLTGVTPEWPSEDKSFAELFARVEMAREVLQTIKPELVNGKDDEEFEFPIAGGRKMTLQAFIRDLALPNVFFHLVTAYDILRKQGVPLGKMDYLAPFLA